MALLYQRAELSPRNTDVVMTTTENRRLSGEDAGRTMTSTSSKLRFSTSKSKCNGLIKSSSFAVNRKKRTLNAGKRAAHRDDAEWNRKLRLKRRRREGEEAGVTEKLKMEVEFCEMEGEGPEAIEDGLDYGDAHLQRGL